MSISETLIQRLKEDDKRFFASDNISNVFKDGDKEALIDELEGKFEAVLRAMVIDVDQDPNSMETARRLAKMYVNELFAGRYDSKPKVTGFPNVGQGKYLGMLIARAELRSMCSHHHQPVRGVSFIGLLPTDNVIGLSKYARIAQWCARRGTLQEELTQEILARIKEETRCEDVAVHTIATHGCMENRGVCAANSMTTTTALSGQFFNPSVKQEFFDSLRLQEAVKP